MTSEPTFVQNFRQVPLTVCEMLPCAKRYYVTCFFSTGVLVDTPVCKSTEPILARKMSLLATKSHPPSTVVGVAYLGPRRLRMRGGGVGRTVRTAHAPTAEYCASELHPPQVTAHSHDKNRPAPGAAHS